MKHIDKLKRFDHSELDGVIEMDGGQFCLFDEVDPILRDQAKWIDELESELSILQGTKDKALRESAAYLRDSISTTTNDKDCPFPPELDFIDE